MTLDFNASQIALRTKGKYLVTKELEGISKSAPKLIGVTMSSKTDSLAVLFEMNKSESSKAKTVVTKK